MHDRKVALFLLCSQKACGYRHRLGTALGDLGAPPALLSGQVWS